MSGLKALSGISDPSGFHRGVQNFLMKYFDTSRKLEVATLEEDNKLVVFGEAGLENRGDSIFSKKILDISGLSEVNRKKRKG